MPFIVQIVIAIVMAVASYYLSARANKKSQRGAQAGTIDTPTVDAGRSIPVVFGRVRVKSPNLLWMGGQRTTEVKK